MSTLKLDVQYDPKPPKVTKATKSLMKHYDFKPQYNAIVLASGQKLNVKEGEIVLFCGPSGCGKSSLLRRAAEQLDAEWMQPDVKHARSRYSVLDNLSGDLKDRVSLLAKCGLSDVPLLLSDPHVLSDGQKYRFSMATSIDAGAKVIAADEWCANLDRTCAKTVCYNVRKLVTKRKLILLVATTHEDIIYDLQPDYIITPFVGSPPQLVRRASSTDLVASWKRSRSKREMLKHGTTSLGGIIEIINAAQV